MLGLAHWAKLGKENSMDGFFLYSLSTHLPSYLAVELLEHVGEAEDECLSCEE